MQYWPSKTAPSATDRGLNWAPALSKLGDPHITASIWTLLSGNVVLSNGSFTNTQANIRVSAGSPHSEAVARNTVTLSNGETYSEDAFIKILP
jgi:IMP cyclohydrolase